MAIDLGATTVHMAVPEAGVVVREPAMVAFSAQGRRPVAVGREAHRLWERGVTEVQIVRPVRDGYVADFDGTVALLRPLIIRALGKRPWFPPQTVISCPAEISPVLLRALQDSVHAAGGGHVITVSKPLAAALGAGLTAQHEEAVMVVDLGGAATDVGIFAGGLITGTRTIPFGGETLDEALVRAVRRETGLRISEATAEQMKEQIGSVNGYAGGGSFSVAASDEETPETQPHDIDAARVPEIVARALEPLMNELLWSVEQLPRNLQHELTDGGVVLTGGGALLRGIEEMVRNTLHLPVGVATDPVSCTILGLEAVLRDLPSLTLNGRAFGARVG